MDTSQSPDMGVVTDSEEISVDSLVQLTVRENLVYGIVRWIGYLPDYPEKSALLEVVYSLYTVTVQLLSSFRNSCSSEIASQLLNSLKKQNCNICICS